MATIGLLHPGEMGSEVGRVLGSTGHDVWWVSDGRSAASRGRAEAAGLAEVPDLATLTSGCEVVLSICPPASALDVARAVAATGFTGLYVDANAVSPSTALQVESVVTANGGRFVDAGITGPPPAQHGSTRMFISGDLAPTVASWFDGSAVEALVVGDRPGVASALKQSYAAWAKGSQALLLAIRSYARAWGVEDELLAEFDRSQPGLRQTTTTTAQRIHRKAWRFDGEMREIAAAFEAAGLPGGMHAAAAQVFGRLADLKDDPADQDPDHVHDRLRGPAG